MRRRRSGTVLIKSNNPDLAGGEQLLNKEFFVDDYVGEPVSGHLHSCRK